MKQPVILREIGPIRSENITCTLACGHKRRYKDKLSKPAPRTGQMVRCMECEREKRTEVPQ